MLSRIATLLLKRSLEREKIISQGKNFKDRKIILLINFILVRTFFLISSSQILKYDAILINHGPFFKGKDSLQLDCLQFLKTNSLMAATIKKQFPKTKFLYTVKL